MSKRPEQTKDEIKVPATRATVVEQEEPAKPLTGLRQKFFGIPVWLYLGFGLFIGAVFVIAVVARQLEQFSHLTLHLLKRASPDS